MASILGLSSVSALDLSVGGGLGYSHAGDKISVANVKSDYSSNLIGLYVFFDAQYVTANVGAAFMVGGQKYSSNSMSESIGKDIKATFFNLSVFGKYPISLGIAKLYPMLGFDFDFNVSAKYKDTKITAENKKLMDIHNRYYVSFGAGADIYVMKNLFIRPTATFGIRMNKPEMVKKWSSGSVKVSHFGHKISISLGVGTHCNLKYTEQIE